MVLKHSIITKMFIGYAAVVIVTLIASLVVGISTRDSQRGVSEFIEVILPELVYLGDIENSTNQLQIATYSLYGTTSSVEQFDQKRAEVSKKLNLAITALNQTSLDLGSLNKDWDIYNKDMSEMRRIMSSEAIDWDLARERLHEISAHLKLIEADIRHIKDAVSSQATNSSDSIIAKMNYALFAITALVLLVTLVSILAYVFSKRYIAAPISKLSLELLGICEDRNLRSQLSSTGKDEVGQAAEGVNQLVSKFRAGMEDVSTAIGKISQSVFSLDKTSSSSEDLVKKMNDDIKQLVDTMTDLDSQSELGSQQAKSAAVAATEGASEVQYGAGKVEETSNSITILANDIESTAEMLLGLRDLEGQVSTVVGTIAEIADQTNLLALNAAIEAARAGDSGRGFAVVADEVRTLSTRTHQSTVEINNILKSIVSSITGAVDSMVSNQEKAKASVELSQETVGNLASISSKILSLSSECNHVAELSVENQKEIREVNDKVQSFKKVGETVLEGSRQTQETSRALSLSANSLNELVAQFKI